MEIPDHPEHEKGSANSGTTQAKNCCSKRLLKVKLE